MIYPPPYIIFYKRKDNAVIDPKPEANQSLGKNCNHYLWLSFFFVA